MNDKYDEAGILIRPIVKLESKMDQIKLPDGWHITYNPKPLSTYDYDFYHDNYDGENGLAGTAEDIYDASEQINEIIAEKNL